MKKINHPGGNKQYCYQNNRSFCQIQDIFDKNNMKIILLAVCLLVVLGSKAAGKTYTQYNRFSNLEGADMIALSDDETTIMLYKKDDVNVNFYRFYDMKPTQAQKWNPAPLYLQTFTNINQDNCVIFAGDQGDVFVGRFTVNGFFTQQKMQVFDKCDLVKVSPSSDKNSFGALCKASTILTIGNLIKQMADVSTIDAGFVIQTFQWHPKDNKVAIAGTKSDTETQMLIIYDNQKKEVQIDLSKYLDDKVQDIEFSDDGSFLAIIYQNSPEPQKVFILNLNVPDVPTFLMATGATQLLELKRKGALLTAYDGKKTFVWEFNDVNYGSYDSVLSAVGLSASGGTLTTIDPTTKELVFSRICEEGQVFLNADLQCAVCESPCKSCFITKSKCSDCVEAFYIDETAYQCKACVDNCKKCSATQCEVCFDGFFLDGAACKPCSTPFVGCSTCSAEHCITCAKNWKINFNHQCHCVQKFVQVETECQPCPPHCQTCATVQKCSTCDVTEHWMETPVEGKCICDLGYYQNPLQQVCSSCITGCLLCDNGVTCNGCDLKSHWTRNKETKLCVCQVGFLQMGQSCKFCGDLMTGCTNCRKENECSQCAEGYDLDSNTHLCSAHPKDDGVGVVVVIVVGICVLIGLGVGSYFLLKMMRKRRERKVQTLLESEAIDQSDMD